MLVIRILSVVFVANDIAAEEYISTLVAVTSIAKSTFPTKNILESYLANLYWQYFQQNRYQFYNRTKTEIKVDSIDFRTWDLTTLFNEISIHFNASLQNTRV